MVTKIKPFEAEIMSDYEQAESHVEVPAGFEGGKEVGSFAPTVDFSAPGAYIVGTFVSMKEGVGPNNSKIYFIERNDGGVVGIWGSTILDSKFLSSGIKPRDKILVQRIEDAPSSRKGFSPAKNYLIKIA